MRGGQAPLERKNCVLMRLLDGDKNFVSSSWGLELFGES